MIKKILAWFKRPLFEVVVRPPAPCGNDAEHYYWTEQPDISFACPVCFAKEHARKRKAAEDAQAEAIAERILKGESFRKRRAEEAAEYERLAHRIANKVMDGMKGTK